MTMALSFASLTEELGCSADRAAVWKIGSGWLESHGIAWCHYAHVAGYAGREDKRLVRYSSLPGPWLRHYDAEDFSSVDPAVGHCLREAAPLVAGHIHHSTPSGRASRFRDDAYGAGFRGSITLPLRMPLAIIGAFCLVTGLEGQEFLAWLQEHSRWVTLAAQVIDARLVELTMPSLTGPRLSPRERESLNWLASGLRYDRIAERMGITLPTVELHVTNARRKLGAKTREQAVALAVALGLLDL